MMTEKVTAKDIRKALMDTYKEPEWYMGFEVGNSTGAECRRHADAVAINAYPSRGFEVRGFEIKVSRSDLQHELDNGTKAEMVAQHCNYWYLVVPKGLTNGMMIPAPWGIIEYSDGKLRQKKKPEYRETFADRGFLMAFLRGWQRRQSEEIADERRKLQEKERSMLSNEVRYELQRYEELKRKVAEFKEVTGMNVEFGVSPWHTRAIRLADKLLESDFSDKRINFHLQAITKMCEEMKSVCVELQKLSCLDDVSENKRGI